MSESRHHLRSVSDLYAADEIEVLLLEEIRDLEPPPTAYSRPEDIQDFEIAGSRTGGAISSHSSELDSPGVHSTVHSWDSHENYHGTYHGNHRHGSSANALPWPRASHLVLVCDIQGHLKTTPGVIRVLLLITSAACLATLCSSGTASVNLFMLPLVGRLRFMIFVTVFCLLVTILLLFLDITHVVYTFPLNWDKVNFWVFTGIGVSYTAGSGLLGLSIWEYHGGGWVPRRTRSQLTVAAGLALSCALIAFVLSWLHGRSGVACKTGSSHDHSQSQLYKPVDSSSSGMTLKDKSPKQPQGWVVKNQKSKKNADSESNATSKGNGNCEKYKTRKDHWASAREAFLPQEDEEVQTLQRDESDLERKRRRRRRDGSGSSGNGVAGKKVESASGSRRVPQKLPLKQIDRPQPRRTSGVAKGPTIKSSRTSTNNDIQSCLAGVKQWDVEGATEAERADAAKALQAAWSGQWRQPPDDVQPCSSKTVDPYLFP